MFFFNPDYAHNLWKVCRDIFSIATKSTSVAIQDSGHQLRRKTMIPKYYNMCSKFISCVFVLCCVFEYCMLCCKFEYCMLCCV